MGGWSAVGRINSNDVAFCRLISCRYVRRTPALRLPRGRHARLVLRRRRGAVLHPAGDLPADRAPRAPARHAAARARRARRDADAGRRGPAAPRRDASSRSCAWPRPRSRRSPASSARACASGAFPSAAASIMPPALAELRATPPGGRRRDARHRGRRGARRAAPGRARRRDGARLRAHAARAAARHRGRARARRPAAHRAALQPPARGPQRDLPGRPARRGVDGVRRGRAPASTPTWSCAPATPPASSPASPSSPRTTARSWAWSPRAWAWR